MDEPLYTWNCQRCGKDATDQREFVWQPDYTSLCEDCFCELQREENL
jgi:predicted nucleic acid-binding Zn ribbon protein